MKVRKLLTAGILLSIGLSPCLQASSVLDAKQGKETESITQPKEGREYITLEKSLASQPTIVEFFSFYCGPCYQFIDKYPVSAAIHRILPEEKVVKYHVDAMGPLGSELTEAWAIAMVMGKTEQVEKPLFEAVKNKNLNNTSDIQSIFSQFGVDPVTYEQLRQSLLVKGTVELQKKAMETFEVRSTPSFYVNGKYKINNSGILASSPHEYADNFAKVVRTLLNK